MVPESRTISDRGPATSAGVMEAGMSEQGKRGVVMVAVLVGLVAVVIVGVMCYKPPGQQKKEKLVPHSPAASGVAVTPVWGEKKLSYIGVLPGGRSSWEADEFVDGQPVVAVWVRRWSDGGRMVRIYARNGGVAVVDTGDVPWTGDGEYEGTLTDEKTGATSKVKVTVKLPAISD